MLENDGYVTMDLNKGAKVASYSKTEVIQFLELREMLEGFIVRLAVPAFKDAEIKKLGKLLEQMKAYKEAGELLKYSQCNQEFHKIIYAACPNQPAVEVTLRLKNQMKKYNSKTILIPGRSDHSLQEHTEIYIGDGKSVGAKCSDQYGGLTLNNGVISSPVRTAPDCAMGTPDDWASRSHAPPSTVPPTTVSTSAMACTRAMASCSIATTV